MREFRSSSAIRTLLVSTSVLGLAAGWAASAQEAKADPTPNGTEVENTTVESVVIGPLESTDYILVSNSTVESHVLNQGNVGSGVSASPSATGILVIDSEVGEQIENAATGEILAEAHGISVIDSLVGDGIQNHGEIHVDLVDNFLGVGAFLADDATGIRAVSYTHLTLPTIYSV